ncbi:MAG: non-canonical purine NTP pyrophosphatase [Verrucomicrobia bacterium]|nr:non-canonical purine NTP pyrophosphatase [Verrucomicrobiota bacterium]
MQTLIIATRNKHKVEEIKSILGTEHFQFLTLDDLPDAPPIVEDGETFADNATRKSVGLIRWILANPEMTHKLEGKPAFVLADDSGLEVDALGGAPGVHSARYAALDTNAPGNSADHENNAKLMRLLGEIPLEKRTARFRCVLALTPIPPDEPGTSTPSEAALLQSTHFFSGACEGRITDAPSGKGGFGYDPLFVPDGYTASFAELGETIKNKLSHRAKALHELQRHFENAFN